MISILLPFLKNVKAGPKTTGLGIVFIMLGGYLAITSNDVLMTVLDSGLVGIGVILFFLKDWQIGVKEKKDETTE